jgi:hypothetical protein
MRVFSCGIAALIYLVMKLYYNILLSTQPQYSKRNNFHIDMVKRIITSRQNITRMTIECTCSEYYLKYHQSAPFGKAFNGL